MLVGMDRRKIVSREAWLVARRKLLAEEKALSRQRDAVSAQRRELPWVKLDKDYVLAGPDGPARLADLFVGRRQLIVYHFMFDPSWEDGCKSCSFIADNFVGGLVHLAARDVAFAVVSRAPLAKLEAFRRRMGWDFRWYSALDSDFNSDFHVSFRPEELADGVEYNFTPGTKFPVSEAPGLSVFVRDGEDIFHTYSTYARGLDLLIGTYNYLDLTPGGRGEDGLAYAMAWVRLHDRYDPAT
jgi:predicted dithiol-disulfide oxidoreductase (DUF899 family)